MRHPDLKVVICGSFGDLEGFMQVLYDLQEKYGTSNVFPGKEHLEKSNPCIFAHHVTEKETEETLIIRSKLMESYFDNIDNADLVVILNEKNGHEHYGIGTTMELGYAYARGKKICFTKQPTNANILSLLKAFNKLNEELYV